MRPNSEYEKDRALLDAVLADDHWQTANSALKANAMRQFHTLQRQRRFVAWMGRTAALICVFGLIGYWFHGRRMTVQQFAVTRNPEQRAATKGRFLTDQELVAAFPHGSCFIAEVDGKKELIFLDRGIKNSFVAQSGSPNN